MRRGEHLVLRAEHAGRVHLEAAGARGPGQPERPGVEPGPEQDDLTAALLAGLGQQVVQEHGAAHHPDPERGPLPAPGRRARVQPARRRERRGQRVGEETVRAGGLLRPHGGDGQPGTADTLQRDRDGWRGNSGRAGAGPRCRPDGCSRLREWSWRGPVPPLRRTRGPPGPRSAPRAHGRRPDPRPSRPVPSGRPGLSSTPGSAGGPRSRRRAVRVSSPVGVTCSR